MGTFDYHTIVNIDTSEEERRKWNIGDIYSNSVRCLECGDIIRSGNRYDFVTCECKNVSIDGGSWYIKRSFKTKNYEELSIMFNDYKEK